MTHDCAEPIEQQREIRRARRCEGLEEAVRAFEHRARAVEAAARHQRRADAGLRGPAGMHALGRGAFGQIFDDARRHAAGDAERRRGLLRRRGRARRRRRPLPRARRSPPSDGSRPCGSRCGATRAQPAHQLRADGDAEQQRSPPRPSRSQAASTRGHDHRARMHRTAFERVVVIFAVRGRAVDQRGVERIEAARDGRRPCRRRLRRSACSVARI